MNAARDKINLQAKARKTSGSSSIEAYPLDDAHRGLCKPITNRARVLAGEEKYPEKLGFNFSFLQSAI